jgi:heme oxygenase
LELRTATRLSHQRLGKRVDIKSRFSHRAAYLAHLKQLWGFFAAFEAAALTFDCIADWLCERTP